MTLRSLTCQVQTANEEAEGSRADEQLEVSERSAACLPREENLNRASFVPISDLHKYIQREEEKHGKGWEHWKRGNRQREQVRGACACRSDRVVSYSVRVQAKENSL